MSAKNDMLPVDVAPESADGGTITYANEVIAIISGIAASEIEGIAGMVTSGGFGDIIGKNRNITRGVKVEVGTEEVSVDLYAMVEYGQPIQTVASQVQENVRKSIETMTGLKVVRVDVHIQGVSFEKEKREVQSNLESANVPNLMGGNTKKKAGKAASEDKAADKKAAAKQEEKKPAEPEAKQPEADKKPEVDKKPEADMKPEADKKPEAEKKAEPEKKAESEKKAETEDKPAAEKKPEAQEQAKPENKPEGAQVQAEDKQDEKDAASEESKEAPASKQTKRTRKA